jgi:hypothetical protein
MKESKMTFVCNDVSITERKQRISLSTDLEGKEDPSTSFLSLQGVPFKVLEQIKSGKQYSVTIAEVVKPGEKS